jgi:hypothetical protein
MHNATIMRLSSCAPNEFRRAAYHYFWIKDDGINLQAFPSGRTNFYVVKNTQQSRSFKLPYMDVECRQRGRRLEGWSKTAASLGGWRKVARQVWFCTWWTGRTAFLFRTVLVVLTRAAQLRADGFQLLLYSRYQSAHTAKAIPFIRFLFWELRGFRPNFYIHVSVSDLYIPRIASLTDTRMWKLGLRPRYSFSGNICFKFSAFFLCSASPATNVKKQQYGLFWKCLFSFSHECAYRKERE